MKDPFSSSGIFSFETRHHSGAIVSLKKELRKLIILTMSSRICLDP